jgi:hypothetical protein
MGRAAASRRRLRSAAARLVTDDAPSIPLSGDLPRAGTSWASLRQRVAWLGRLRLSPCLYAGAAVSYIAIGVFVNDFMLSWVVGFAWLLLWVWALPAAVRRLRR